METAAAQGNFWRGGDVALILSPGTDKPLSHLFFPRSFFSLFTNNFLSQLLEAIRCGWQSLLAHGDAPKVGVSCQSVLSPSIQGSIPDCLKYIPLKANISLNAAVSREVALSQREEKVSNEFLKAFTLIPVNVHQNGKPIPVLELFQRHVPRGARSVTLCFRSPVATNTTLERVIWGFLNVCPGVWHHPRVLRGGGGAALGWGKGLCVALTFGLFLADSSHKSG